MRSSRVRIGLIGLPRDESQQVLDSLARQPRLEVASVFDPCLSAAEMLAERVKARVAVSLRTLLRECQGIVIGDVKWLQTRPLRWVAQERLPTLILRSAHAGMDRSQLSEVHRLASETDALLMPELLHRWMPSTLRLRELTATRMGAIESIRMTCPLFEANLELVRVLDWCGNVVQSHIESIRAEDQATFGMRFRRKGERGQPVEAAIQITPGSPDLAFPVERADITCRHGRIRILGRNTLHWECGEIAREELLSSERSAWDVMFDLFGRRLVGGIVPVPDLEDLLRGDRALNALGRSRQGGDPQFVG